MSQERFNDSEITSLWQYYNDPRVVRAIRQFSEDVSDGDPVRWETFHRAGHAYFAVENPLRILGGRKSPASSRAANELDHEIRRHGGQVGINVSLMPESRIGWDYPASQLVVCDIDGFGMHPSHGYFHRKDDVSPLIDPEATFGALAPIITMYQELLHGMQIPIMITMTGKGIHVLFRVSDVHNLERIKHIGGPVEETVKHRLENAHQWTKRQGPIPLHYQQIHRGAARLSQFLNMQIINRARWELGKKGYKGEILTMAEPGNDVSGFAFDNVHGSFLGKNLSALGSVNFAKAMQTGKTPPPYTVQIPLEGNGYNTPWHEGLHIRDNWSRAARYLGERDCHVPSATNIDPLIEAYYRSGLRRLHEAMDQTEGDPPWKFGTGYRNNNYQGIVNLTKDSDFVRHVIDHAPTYFNVVMNFWVLNKLVWEVFEGMGGSSSNLAPTPHVAGFLRALFEDPYKHFGRARENMDISLYVRGMVEQVLGQMFAQ